MSGTGTTLTVTFTDEYAARTGTATVTCRYSNERAAAGGLGLLGALENLLAITEATSADVMRVDLS